MVDFNLIDQLGAGDDAAEAMLREALGASGANRMDAILGGGLMQDFTPGSILKGKVIGFEKLNFVAAELEPVRVAFETVAT